MNLAGQGGDPTSNLLFVNFNQDCTSLAVGTKNGYKLFSLSSIDKLENIYEGDTDDICIVERLFSSSLVAIVSLSSPRKLKVCHFKKGTEICNYSYSNTILAVRLNRLRLVVCLEESLYIHNIRDMKVLHTIRDTPPNPHGLCALSVNNDNCYLAYPGSNQIGEVQIFDCVNLRAVTMIPAHDNPLAALAFNSLGTKLATASEKGTVIRVFSIPDGQKLFEFRRGVKRCATINSLAFSLPDSLFLSCSSNTETVHVFKLENSKENPPEESQSWMGYFGQALKTSSQYLPSQVTEMFKQGRDFAVARLPFSGLKNVCSLANIQKRLYLVVGCQDGYLYIYGLDINEGGECTLVKQHRIDGRQDTPGLSEPTTGSSTNPASVGTGSGSSPPGGGGAAATGSYASSLLQQPDKSDLSSAARLASGKQTIGPSRVLDGDPLTQAYSGVWVGHGYAHAVLTTSSERRKSATTEGKLEAAIRCQESLPYKDMDDLAVGGDNGAMGIGALRLDDENEFPPMMQKGD